jgi:hypothetical protein
MKTTKFVCGILLMTCAAINSVQAQSNLTNGLVTYYPFNGNTTDVSGNGNNGTLGSGIGYTNDRFGNPNSALFFTNGAAGQMTTTTLQPSNNIFTICEWFNLPNGYTNYGPLICLMDTKSGVNSKIDKTLQVGPFGGATTNVLNFYLFPTHQLYLPSPQNVADGKWHHAVATLSPQGMYLYLDGSLVASNSNTLSQGFAGYLRITPGQGAVDDVRVYNRALSSDEVGQLYVTELQPQVGLIKAVKPVFSNLSVGTNYQLQLSSDLNTWTNQGNPFTATSSTMTYSQYWDVDDWGKLFFRLQATP